MATMLITTSLGVPNPAQFRVSAKDLVVRFRQHLTAGFELGVFDEQVFVLDGDLLDVLALTEAECALGFAVLAAPPLL